jgi:oligoendopeptidase F
MRALLDPKNGRLDIGPAPYRTDRPGFATGLVGYPSFFFQGSFNGFVDDAVILVHEAGHAVQNMLMDRRGVLPRYANGPSYFTESYAALNELLLLEHLYRSSTSANTRIYYLERLLDQTADLFRNGAEALFEHRVYDSVAAGRTLGARDLDRIFQESASRFSVWYERPSNLQMGWTRPLQVFTWPLYRLNYAMAKLLALNYLQRMKADPRFVTRYQSLLSRGYDAPPDELLRAEVGVDVANHGVLVRDAVAQMERWVLELEQLYRSTP